MEELALAKPRLMVIVDVLALFLIVGLVTTGVILEWVLAPCRGASRSAATRSYASAQHASTAPGDRDGQRRRHGWLRPVDDKPGREPRGRSAVLDAANRNSAARWAVAGYSVAVQDTSGSRGRLRNRSGPQGRAPGKSVFLALARRDWGEVHFWLAAAFLALMGVHVYLHWRSLYARLWRGRERTSPL